MKEYEFAIFADYFMIFVQDDSLKTKYNDVHWSDEDLRSMAYIVESGFIIGTARDMDVHLIVNIHDSKPDIKENEWDQIVQCGINLPSGILSISGTSDYIEDHRKIEIGRGVYQALICYAGLGTLSDDGLEGSDSYLINIWPSDTYMPKEVLKQWNQN